MKQPTKLPIITIATHKKFLETPSKMIVDFKNPELALLAQDMIETMHQAEGIGLAAPQIGRDIRLIIVNAAPEPLVMINPEITWKSWRKETDWEGCLSIPKTFGKVKRSKSLTVTYQTLQNETKTLEAKGLLARVIQHEVDHIDGILFVSKAKDVYTEKNEL